VEATRIEARGNPICAGPALGVFSGLFNHRTLPHFHFVLQILRPRSPWWLTPKHARWLKRVGLALGVYAIVGFLILPAIIKWQLRKQLPALTHRAARVDAVRVNPFALSLTIRDLALTEPDGSTFASFSNLYVNFEAAASLLNRAWTFKEIRLASPYGYFAVLTNGQFNFANLLTNAPAMNAPPSPKKPLPTVLVKSLVITTGVVAVADFYRAAPFETKFVPINVRLTNFTTRLRTGTPYSFSASTSEGEFFNWAGSLTAVPPASAGRFELGEIDLKKYSTYLNEFVQFDVGAGKVTVGAAYSFALGTNGFDLVLTNGTMLLTNLQVFAPSAAGEPASNLVSIPSLVAVGAHANLLAHSAALESVESFGGSISARRFRNGTLELLALATPPTNRAPSILNPPATATNAVPAATSAPWSIRVQNVAAKDYTVHVVDEQTPTVAHLAADQLALTVTGFLNASNAPVAVNFSARVNGGGTAKLDARGTLFPMALETDLDVQGVELRPFQPYVEQQRVKLAFTSGNVSTKGRASLTVADTNPPSGQFSGDVILKDVAVIDQIVFQDFARWKQVAVRGIDFVLAPMSVKVKELACDDLVTSIVVDTNKQLTALAALPPKTNATASVAAVAPPQPSTNAASSVLPFPLQLDLLALTNASIRFADLSIEPHCRFAVEQFSGTIQGLSSTPGAMADVDISGRVNESAPFAVTGKINPLAADLFVDLVISNRNTELTAFTPYMEKFAGYPLQKGKLSVALKYAVHQGALEARNIVLIDQLTLGQRNNNPDATKLPVKLGVALLKDRNGRIELDVPVKGRLDDPKFRVGPIIWQVVMNLLTKAATSPFALLGALVGGGEELSFIEFAPGQSAIQETEAPKIEKLGRALYDRPALSLEMTGSTDDSLDHAALAWVKLERELKALRMAELAGKNNAPASAEEIRFEPREYARTLKAHYKQRFNRSRPLPQDSNAETNSAAAAIIGPGRSTIRPDVRKGAEMLSARDNLRPITKMTNAVAASVDVHVATRPATLPKLDADDETLAQMERELFSRIEIDETDLRELMQQRAQSVQRALLQTQKVEGERLFILAPKAPGAASKGQSRVNLSLN
jgi:hypothetical protein